MKIRNNKIQILTILNSLNVGGIENTLLSFVKNSKDSNLKMTICCFKKGGTLEKDFEDKGIDIIYIKKTHLIFFDFIQLLCILYRKKYTIIHSRFGYSSLGFALASKFARIPFIISFHSSVLPIFKKNINGNFLKILLIYNQKMNVLVASKLATIVIGHSKTNLNANFKKWESKSKFKVIYNGVDFKQLEADKSKGEHLNNFLSKDDFVLLHVGTFKEEKNHIFMLHCFHSLLKKEKKHKLILVGYGKMIDEIKDTIRKLKLNEYVFLAGNDMKLKKYFKIADLFFFPSKNEGFGNVLIEAQSQSTPIVASDIPALYESVFVGYHKYFFDPNNLTNCTEKLDLIISDVKNKKLQNTIIDAEKYVSENFSINIMSQQLVDLYYQISKDINH